MSDAVILDMPAKIEKQGPALEPWLDPTPKWKHLGMQFDLLDIVRKERPPSDRVRDIIEVAQKMIRDEQASDRTAQKTAAHVAANAVGESV